MRHCQLFSVGLEVVFTTCVGILHRNILVHWFGVLLGVLLKLGILLLVQTDRLPTVVLVGIDVLPLLEGAFGTWDCPSC